MNKELRNANLASARLHLESARARRLSYVLVDVIRKYLRDANATLEDIGTSETELDDLARKGRLAEASDYLRRDRENPCNSGVDAIRLLLKNANATPKDIGTSEAELDELARKGHLAEASDYLRRNRQNPSDAGVTVIRIRIQDAKAVPEDIGTSEAELDALARKGYLAEASDYLRKNRENPSDAGVAVIRLRLKNAKLTPEDIGTSEAELDALARKNQVK